VILVFGVFVLGAVGAIGEEVGTTVVGPDEVDGVACGTSTEQKAYIEFSQVPSEPT
jgi:hypothetical protein